MKVPLGKGTTNRLHSGTWGLWPGWPTPKPDGVVLLPSQLTFCISSEACGKFWYHLGLLRVREPYQRRSYLQPPSCLDLSYCGCYSTKLPSAGKRPPPPRDSGGKQIIRASNVCHSLPTKWSNSLIKKVCFKHYNRAMGTSIFGCYSEMYLTSPQNKPEWIKRCWAVK